MPTGTVSFLDGTTVLGTSGLTAGVAALTTSTLAAGSHSITAVYSGDANFVTQTSPVLTEAVDDFSLSIPTGDVTSLTIFPGGTGVFTLSMSPAGATTVPVAVTLSLSGLPSGATYAFSPATLPAGSGTTTVTLTINIPLTIAAAGPIRLNGGGVRINHGDVGRPTIASGGLSTDRSSGRKLTPFALALFAAAICGRDAESRKEAWPRNVRPAAAGCRDCRGGWTERMRLDR